MRSGSDRWMAVSDSEFAHERAGLDLVRELLPQRAPHHVWADFEFGDGQGSPVS